MENKSRLVLIIITVMLLSCNDNKNSFWFFEDSFDRKSYGKNLYVFKIENEVLPSLFYEKIKNGYKCVVSNCDKILQNDSVIYIRSIDDDTSKFFKIINYNDSITSVNLDKHLFEIEETDFIMFKKSL